MTKGNIIVLNGVSSSGKSTLSKVLMKSLRNYFHFSIDDFDCMIEKMEEREMENGRLIPIATERFYHDNIKMFSDYGVNIIADQILHNEETMNDFLEKLHDYPILFVGVHCSGDELLRREAQRRDRPIGQGKSQLSFVHQQNEEYDVEVNTENEPMEQCAEKILDVLQKIEQLDSIKKTYQNWKTTCKANQV